MSLNEDILLLMILEIIQACYFDWIKKKMRSVHRLWPFLQWVGSSTSTSFINFLHLKTEYLSINSILKFPHSWGWIEAGVGHQELNPALPKGGQNPVTWTVTTASPRDCLSQQLESGTGAGPCGTHFSMECGCLNYEWAKWLSLYLSFHSDFPQTEVSSSNVSKWFANKNLFKTN